MRLINADKLLENLEWLEEYDHIIYETIKGSIDIAQTVEAIPTEWVIELSNKLKNDEDDFEKAMFLLDLADLWRKENE